MRATRATSRSRLRRRIDLCDAVNAWLATPITPADVAWSYAGVRALFDDGAASASEVTRDYVLDLDAPAGAAKLLSVFGGKITTYRRLAEHALQKLGVPGSSWTATKPLPGGDMPGGDFCPWFADFPRAPSGPADGARDATGPRLWHTRRSYSGGAARQGSRAAV